MATVYSVAQSLNPDGIVSLFRLDLTPVGGPVVHFVQGSKDNGEIAFQGIPYTPVDCEFEGFEVSGVGGLPTPKVRIANVGSLPQSLVNNFGDLLGCEIVRLRTFRRFLDNGSSPDPTAFFGPDIFRVERKTNENRVFIEWELSAAIDQEGKKLPGRSVIRDTCPWRYRSYVEATDSFDYSKAQCPYNGGLYFDINDQPVTDKADDKPSRRLSCCKTRFGENAALPFGGFPGVARVRQ